MLRNRYAQIVACLFCLAVPGLGGPIVAPIQRVADGVGGFEAGEPEPSELMHAIAVIGDVDGDGNEDYAVSDPDVNPNGAVWVLFRKADGTIREQTRIEPGRAGFALELPETGTFGLGLGRIGDFDGDGVPDLAVGGRNQGAQVVVLLLNRDGSVRDHFDLRIETDEWVDTDISLALLGDLRGDGTTALAVGIPFYDRDDGAVFIAFLRPDGSLDDLTQLALPEFSTQAFGRAVAALDDQDGDGLPELAVSGGRRLWLFSLDSTGAWERADLLDFGGGGSARIALARGPDLDGDGRVELLVGRNDAGVGDGTGAVLVYFFAADLRPRTVLSFGLRDLNGVVTQDAFGRSLSSFVGAPGRLLVTTNWPRRSVWEVEITCAGPDIDQNGIPDNCDLDCNDNGVSDICDVDPSDPDGDGIVFEDCDGNLRLDDCELNPPPVYRGLFDADCNGNGLVDACEIADGSAIDLDNDGVIDDCWYRSFREITNEAWTLRTQRENERFRHAVPIGDLDGNGATDVAAFSTNIITDQNRLWILFLDATGLPQHEVVIPLGAGLVGQVIPLNLQGAQPTVLIGWVWRETEAEAPGALELLSFNPDGTIAASRRIERGAGLPENFAVGGRLGTGVTLWQEPDEQGSFEVIVSTAFPEFFRLRISTTGDVLETQTIDMGALARGFNPGRLYTLDDLDGDGRRELLNVDIRDDGGPPANAEIPINVLFLDDDLQVVQRTDIGPGLGGLHAPPGGNVGVLQDANGNGRREVVYATSDNLWFLELAADGTVAATRIGRTLVGGGTCISVLESGDILQVRPTGMRIYHTVCGGDDCAGDGVVDACATDCDDNGVPDACEDFADCNANGIPDSCDIAGGLAQDCDEDGVPDSCAIDKGSVSDVFPVGGDRIPDLCQQDCNGNGQPDRSEIAAAPGLDCNRNGLPDDCDLAAQTSLDRDLDGVPDECTLRLRGTLAIDDFRAVQTLDNPQPLGDLNRDGTLDWLATGQTDANSDALVLFGAEDGQLLRWTGLREGVADLLGGVGELGNSVLLGDLEGDGTLELAVLGTDLLYLVSVTAEAEVTQVRTIEAGMPGGLEDVTEWVDPSSGLAALGDLDGDRVPDLAVSVSRPGPDSLWILFLRSDGTLKAAREHPEDGFALADDVVVAGDVNRDGTVDLLVAQAAYLILGGDGTVRQVVPAIRLGDDLLGSAAPDLNADGVPDRVSRRLNQVSFSLMTQQGAVADRVDTADHEVRWFGSRVLRGNTMAARSIGFDARSQRGEIRVYDVVIPPCPRAPTVFDLNGNGVSDLCDVESGSEGDCDQDGVLDRYQEVSPLDGGLAFELGHVNAPTSAELQFEQGDPLGIEVWVRYLPRDVEPFEATLLAKNRDQLTNYELSILDGQLRFGFTGAQGADYIFSSDEPVVPAGAWTHLAVTHHFGGETILYADGVPVGGAWNQPPNQAPSPLNQQLRIGALRSLGGMHTNQFLGQMDELRIFRTIRTPAQIAGDRNRAIDPAAPGLVAYWRFDEGTGSTAADLVAGRAANLIDVGWVTGCGSCLGDLDGDRRVSLADLVLLLQNLSLPEPDPAADLDEDGDVDMLDLQLLLGRFGRSCLLVRP